MILFKPVFVLPIIRLEKRVTRRPYNAHRVKQFPVGSVHGAYCRPPWCDGKPFAKLEVLRSSVDTALLVTDAEARLEGFDSADAFREALCAIYKVKRLNAGTPLLRIEFEVVETFPRVVRGLTD